MRARIRALTSSIVTLLAVASTTAPALAQPGRTAALAAAPSSIRAWDATVDAMLRGGELAVRHAEADTLLSGRTPVRLQQFHRLARSDLGRQCIAANCYCFHSELSNPNAAQPAKPRSERVRRLRSKISAASGTACTARAMLSSRSRCSVG